MRRLRGERRADRISGGTARIGPRSSGRAGRGRAAPGVRGYFTARRVAATKLFACSNSARPDCEPLSVDASSVE